MSGYIYVLSNDSMPGLLKVGWTARTARHRARELSKPTGVPMPFRVEYERRVPNPVQTEAIVHQRLNRYHVGGEFFRLDVGTAVQIIERSVGVEADSQESSSPARPASIIIAPAPLGWRPQDAIHDDAGSSRERGDTEPLPERSTVHGARGQLGKVFKAGRTLAGYVAGAAEMVGFVGVLVALIPFTVIRYLLFPLLEMLGVDISTGIGVAAMCVILFGEIVILAWVDAGSKERSGSSRT